MIPPPQVKLRRFRLERALREYPLYDPPHKVEERLLASEKAAENFDYFMRMRCEGYWRRRVLTLVPTSRT
jgi:hypothetical protein